MELLVVIAIIGILSSVVLVSLSSIQKKSKDNGAITSMNQLKVGAEMNYNINGSYSSICPSSSLANGRLDVPGSGDSVANNPILTQVKQAQKSLTGTTGAINSGAPGSLTCASSGTSYAVSIKLNNDYFCIDSTNFAEKRVTAGLSGNACPSS